MALDIKMGPARKSGRSFSPFPRAFRQFTESATATKDVVLGPGLSLPDLIRRYYPKTTPEQFSAHYGFLSRDDKDRDYEPGKDDRFVFHSNASIAMFKAEALELIKFANKLWTNLGMPLLQDKDRGLSLPDTAKVWEAMKSSSEVTTMSGVLFKNLSYVASNVDIMKKFCIVRAVSPGWWAVNYAGKNSADPQYFSTSLKAHEIVLDRLIKSGQMASMTQRLWDDAGDPLDTNPGYPFFSGQVSKDGTPTNRVKIIQSLAGITSEYKDGWSTVLRSVDHRLGRFGMTGHPFAVAPIRRLSYGYKWIHQFNSSSAGLVSMFDERGLNTQRVAWMVPYGYNLCVTPLQIMMKSFRLWLPGLYHDSLPKANRGRVITQASRRNECYLAEADYSNYDRFIPVDLVEKITSMFASRTNRPEFWSDIGMHLHRQASIIWPDYSGGDRGHGWVFKPGTLGLMSGVKLTSETGTLINSVVNAAALAKAKGWSVDQLASYLGQYIDRPYAKVGSKWEHYYIQSDDTLLIGHNLKSLSRQGENFLEAVDAAGLKGSLDIGDRFLMRHCEGGRDLPVVSRVWQNTLSNEEEPADELVFLAGLAARTDGLCGFRTIDAFQLGDLYKMSKTEALLTHAVLTSLRKFITTAAVKSTTALKLIDGLLSVLKVTDSDFERLESASSQAFLLQPHSIDVSAIPDVNALRKAITQALAERERELAAKGTASVLASSWIYKLFRDRHVPSSSLILTQLAGEDASIRAELDKFAGLEHNFFLYAANELGLKPLEYK